MRPEAEVVVDAQPERPDVFISYSRADTAFVRQVVEGLAERGKSAWVDWEDIRTSIDWRATVYAGIEAARVVVPVLSPDFARSEICRDEIEHALAHNKRLVPIVARAVVATDVHPELAKPNWIVVGDDAGFDGPLDDLVESIETDHEWLDAHARLVVRAREWERKGCDPSFLLRGTDLESAELWLSQQRAHRQAPTSLQSEYIVASRRAATRRLRRTLAATVVALAIAALLAVVAWTQRQEAVANAQQARSRELAATALSELRVDPTLAVLLARQAARTRPTAQAEEALRSILAAYRPMTRLRGQRGVVNSVAFSHDGRFVLTAASDGTARVWDVRTGARRATLPSRRGEVTAAAFAPNGNEIAVATATEVAIWSGGRPRHVLRPEVHGVSGVTFDSRARYLAASGPGGVEIWSTRSWRRLRRLHAGGTPLSATFNPDGRLVATAGDRGVVQLWTVDGHLLHTERVNGSATDVAFSPDGTTFAAAEAFTGRLYRWSAADGKRLSTSRGPKGFVLAVQFRQGLPVVATAGDGAVEVWDGTSRRVVDTLPTGGTTLAGAFSPDGSRFIGAGDAAPIIWRLNVPAEVLHAPHGMGIVQLALDRGGHRVVGMGDLGNAVIWSMATGRPSVTIEWPGHQIYGIDVSNDGATLITRDTNGVARTWSMRNGRALGRPREPMMFEQGADATIPSFDGRRLAIIREGEAITIWDARTKRNLASIPNPERAGTAAWSEDGTRLAIAGGGDDAVHVYAIPSATEVTLLRDVGPVSFAVFSGDGQRLTTLANSEGAARMWDVKSGLSTVVANVPWGNEAVMAISPDATAFASANWDRVAVVRCSVCGDLRQLLERANRLVPRELSTRERMLFLHDSQG